MRKNFLTMIALIAVFVLVFAGCGKKESVETAPETVTETVAPVETAAPVLGLDAFHLTSSTWSSPNGATVVLSATPNSDSRSCSAAFVVRLEGEEVANIPCEGNGSTFTASADLNAADGLCYYVILTSADGNTAEIPVNTPNVPTDEALINMAAALESYCNLMVEDSSFADGILTVTAGSVQIQTPTITNNGEIIGVTEAALALHFNGQRFSSNQLDIPAVQSTGAYDFTLSDVTFQVPEMENDQQLTLVLDVTLSNGQSLSTTGGTFIYNDGELLTVVG